MFPNFLSAGDDKTVGSAVLSTAKDFKKAASVVQGKEELKLLVKKKDLENDHNSCSSDDEEYDDDDKHHHGDGTKSINSNEQRVSEYLIATSILLALYSQGSIGLVSGPTFSIAMTTLWESL